MGGCLHGFKHADHIINGSYSLRVFTAVHLSTAIVWSSWNMIFCSKNILSTGRWTLSTGHQNNCLSCHSQKKIATTKPSKKTPSRIDDPMRIIEGRWSQVSDGPNWQKMQVKDLSTLPPFNESAMFVLDEEMNTRTFKPHQLSKYLIYVKISD